MSVEFIGTKSLGAINIGVALAIPAIGSALGEILTLVANLEAQIAANLSIAVTLPDPAAIAAAIAAAAAEAVARVGEILASIPAPLIEANLDLNAQLTALFALKLSLQGILATLGAAMSAGGVHAFKVDSTPADIGSDLAALVSGGIGGGLPTARIQGVLLVTESPATFTAMSTVLLTG